MKRPGDHPEGGREGEGGDRERGHGREGGRERERERETYLLDTLRVKVEWEASRKRIIMSGLHLEVKPLNCSPLAGTRLALVN